MALVTRSRRNDYRGRWLSLLLAWTLVSGLPAGSLAAVALTEYEVKAGFLYHVGWFVEWPATTVQERAPTFIIGVLGTNPFGGVLDDVMRGKAIRERPVVIKYYQRVEEAVSSHVLFISASEEPRLPAILAVLERTRVLTVSDLERFAERGGMIVLRLVDRKVHFDINMDATERTGLKLSSQLLRLAKVIHGTQRVRE
jgi:YfiR/HmsC-like